MIDSIGALSGLRGQHIDTGDADAGVADSDEPVTFQLLENLVRRLGK
ncbi:hypothetical protein [Mycolicibacterium frederiksbergense]|nr:hypothetical protein [Mycolicibacterium frederiksbergense]